MRIHRQLVLIVSCQPVILARNDWVKVIRTLIELSKSIVFKVARFSSRCDVIFCTLSVTFVQSFLDIDISVSEFVKFQFRLESDVTVVSLAFIT